MVEQRHLVSQYLVVLARAGSSAAFERLVRLWTPRLLRHAARLLGAADLARDVVQETWLVAVRRLHALEDAASFPAWIHRIVHRRCVDAIRARQRSRRLADGMTNEAHVSTHLAATETLSEPALAAALAALGADHREVIELFYAQDLSVDDIATVLGIPRGTIKSRLFHARATLKQLLGDRHE